MRATWAEAKAAIKKILPEIKFSMWIEPVEYLESRGDHVFLLCPNEFHCRRCQDKFAGMVSEKLSETAGRALTCVFQPGPKKDGHKSAARTPVQPRQEPQQLLPNFSPSGGRMLRKDLTFDSFVVGGSNDLAFAASLSLASRKSSAANALFLLSKPGLGKTHLAQAVGHHIMTVSPTDRIYYISADDFSAEMVAAFRRNSIHEFQEKYRRQCDVLILENVQYLSGKERTQLELALTLDSLMDSDKRIIFSSCYLPADIPKLSPELRSRLACGLISSIDVPDYRTRVRILQRKATGLDIPMEIIHFLASDLTEDIRQLEGGLMGVTARATLLGTKVDMEMAQTVAGQIKNRKERITVGSIKKLICKHYRISEQELVSRSRKAEISRPRMIGIYLARMHTDLSLQAIGQAFNRYHATALHALGVIDREVKAGSPVKRQLEYLQGKLSEGG